METAIESQIARDGGKADVQIGDGNVSMKIQDEMASRHLPAARNVAFPEDLPEGCSAVLEDDCGHGKLSEAE